MEDEYLGQWRDTTDQVSRPESSEPFVVARHLQKHYGGVHALKDASLRLYGGEIHAVMGENGSGKSTLLSIVAGLERADLGHLEISSLCRRPNGKTAIAMVTQELALAEELTVAENIFLSHAKPRSRVRIRWKSLVQHAQEILDDLDLAVAPSASVSQLRLDQKQLVEVARAVALGAQIVIFDEASSALPEDGARTLASVMRRVKGRGGAVVFVSHRLDEVLDLSDRITVLRDGVSVYSGLGPSLTKERLVSTMLGSESKGTLVTAKPQVAGTAPLGAHDVVSIRNVTSGIDVHDVSFDVAQGECVGLVGLTGSGRSELLEVLYGLRTHSSGSLVDRFGTDLPHSPRFARKRGIRYISADRKGSGIFPNLTVKENILVGPNALVSRLPGWRLDGTGTDIESLCQSVGLGVDVSRKITTLSGGNQQKALIARNMSVGVGLLLMDEPTRGVDVGTRRELHQHMLKYCAGGGMILMSSSELDEVEQVCSRVIIMVKGAVDAVLETDEINESALADLIGGG